jgi:hypothetical protein
MTHLNPHYAHIVPYGRTSVNWSRVALLALNCAVWATVALLIFR